MKSEVSHEEQLTTLAQRAAAGEVSALESLCELLLPRVRNLVRYLVRGDRDVDDLTQDALVAILRGIGGYGGQGAFRSWADRVVSRSVFASRKRAQIRVVSSEVVELAAPEGGANSEQYTMRRQMVEQLDRLPEAQRHALVLHHVMGLTANEVAAELAVPVETVRSRLRLGRERLRAFFACPPESQAPREAAAGEERSGHG